MRDGACNPNASQKAGPAAISIAITDDHRALGSTVSDFLARNGSRSHARQLLASADEQLPPFWKDVAGLGWLGLHLPEEHGGSGFGFEELVVVAEEAGRAVCPGPLVPTLVASAVIEAVADKEVAARLVPDLASGAAAGAFGLEGSVKVSGGKATGDAGVVLGAGTAGTLLALSPSRSR